MIGRVRWCGTTAGPLCAPLLKRFPSSRCASAIQIVRPLESIAETQPQLHPALLRLSAMISQYFTRFDCASFALQTATIKVILNVSLDAKLAAMRPISPMRFQKKLVDQMSLGYAQYSHSDMIAKRRWHTDIDRRRLVWKILSGARLSRR
jgi:hypothetical protein